MSKFATYPSLAGKLVLITGGAQGIGAAAVEQFAQQGARVAFLDIADEPATALIARISSLVPHSPIYYTCDLADIPALQSTVAGIAATHGAPGVLVNNAASDDRHRFEDVTPAYWDERIAINLRHHYFAAQAVVPFMKAAGAGSIINMSSIAPLIPTPDLSIYNMAKSAVTAMTRSLGHELGPFNIRVNSVLPGAILTERQRRLYMSPEYEQYVSSVQHIKRHILPEEVARLILFLAADDSAAITSQSHIIDAGWI
jgi:NAD(P)-dependent dehydrogenase (short-subunit alcohol dehydrogenase family)